MTEYLKSKNISFEEIAENLFSIDNKKFLFLEERERLFNGSFDFILKEEELDVECDYFAFKWGTRYYYSPIDETQFNQLLYLGKPSKESDYSNLGIHGKYELLNGTRDYKDWVRKAKYLGHKALGICELQTLAGTIQFQKACAEEGIKSILGSTGLIKYEKNKFPIKFYVKDKIGWRNALLINKEQNVVNANDPFFTIEFLKEHSKGLIFVINPNTPKEIYKNFDKSNTYFQLDPSELFSNKLDIEWLENTKKFLKEGKFEPVLLQDTYYLEPEDSVAKDFINRVSKSNDSNFYKDHYFKSLEELQNQFDELNLDHTDFEIARLNNVLITEECNYEIDLKSRHLPKYEMNEDEAAQFESNDELFFHKIQEGLEKKVIPFKEKDIEVYLERIDKEVKVLEMGGVKDYFLIMADICRFCDESNIVRGHGRGSAAGSIISYLFSITEVDPIEYGLIFERFLNEGRVQTELPDIDTDVSDRDTVKRYLEEKYGYNYVSSIGTYGTYQVKNLFNEMCSDSGVDSGTMRYMSKIISKEYTNSGFTGIMKCCVKNKKLRDFVNQNIVEKADFFPTLIEQPKNRSVHASGVIIVPKEDEEGNPMDIYTWMPVKSMDGHLISEWEGKELEGAGFLKEDLLGLKQLEKFQRMLELIKQNHGIDINIFDIDLEDKKVFDYFGEGVTEDVFQFGTSGLKSYCNDLKPDNVGELAAANALYRPGAMESNAHTDFIKLKYGQKDPEYDYMLEEVTKETSGLYIFQETIMKACQVLGGFSLVEADGIRKAMGKKIKEKMDSYKVQFLAGAKERGCPNDEAMYIWNKLEVFSGYGFNKCISGNERLHRVGINYSGKATFNPTIGQMYHIKNNYSYAKMIGKKSLHGKYKRGGYGTGFSLTEDNRLKTNKIKDIRYAGYKLTYRVTLENGVSIDVTDNHKFPTEKGEFQLKDLKVGDKLFSNEGYLQERKERTFELGRSTNYPSKGQMGFQKNNESTTFTDFRDNRETVFQESNGICLKCSKETDRIEVHHIDCNHLNNDIENLIALCPSCHKKEHYKLNRMRMGKKGLVTKLVPIKSIEPLGKENVYDVEMEAPYHTFTTQKGMVTCNSHAVSYSIIGYISQWFKINYPLEFWMTSLEMSTDDERPKRLNEINQHFDINVKAVDINKSGLKFELDKNTNSIYYSISSVKQVGAVSVPKILEEREQNGFFFSLAEFVERIPKKFANKRVIINLILCGAFDEIENIKNERDRFRLIDEYTHLNKIKNTIEDFTPHMHDEFWWQMQKVELSGIGFLNYEKKAIDLGFRDFKGEIDSLRTDKFISIGGICVEIDKKKNDNGNWAIITINSNNELIKALAWQNFLEENESKILSSKGKFLFLSGVTKADYFDPEKRVLSLNNNSQIEIL